MAILKIEKTPITVTIRNAKVAAGNFGAQLQCGVVDDAGEDHLLYLP